ncbi:MAG: SprT-like domain-containing protein [Firmicutes bacterium]|nr:SprT-like domain-containing protein [Bacillota bacterium]
MKNCNEIYQENLKALNEAFDFLNYTFFGNTLSKTVITIQADYKQRAYGWFTCYDAWNSKDLKSAEINLSANYLDRPAHETVGTLLHEMCHQWAYENGVQDCSRAGTYHNKRFKEIAERHGLVVEFMQGRGWAVTKLADESRQKIESILGLLTLKRVIPSKKAGKKSSTRKYECQECGMSVRATLNYLYR